MKNNFQGVCFQIVMIHTFSLGLNRIKKNMTKQGLTIMIASYFSNIDTESVMKLKPCVANGRSLDLVYVGDKCRCKS